MPILPGNPAGDHRSRRSGSRCGSAGDSTSSSAVRRRLPPAAASSSPARCRGRAPAGPVHRDRAAGRLRRGGRSARSPAPAPSRTRRPRSSPAGRRGRSSRPCVRKPSCAMMLAHFLAPRIVKKLTRYSGLPVKTFAQLGVLRRHADRAGIRVALAHHHAAAAPPAPPSRSRTPRRPAARAMTTSRPVFIWPSACTPHAAAQAVQHQRLLRLRQAQFPRQRRRA